LTRAMLASAGISCHRVSVCLFVCLSQVGVPLKQLKVGSLKHRHTIGQDSSFLMPKISASQTGSPPAEAPNPYGYVKIGNFNK